MLNKKLKQIAKEIAESYYLLGCCRIAKLPEEKQTNDIHLKWMCQQIYNGSVIERNEAHRWLGFVQGVLCQKFYIKPKEINRLNRTGKLRPRLADIEYKHAIVFLQEEEDEDY